MRRWLAALAAVGCMAAASDPVERLPDAAQESRARALFGEIRCVVCQNETIDGSEAELAADLRRLVREQVRAGRTDAEIKRVLVDRYGEFVLFRPAFSPGNAALWLTPFLLLVGGAGVVMLRRRRVPEAAAPLTAEEERELQFVLERGPEPDDRNVT
ncbi:MAG TPA: cytochrome c-type biogenesis protein [Caulobacteraceae bacterium]|jgi:cytochrome c-type biogenesis protein CcmH